MVTLENESKTVPTKIAAFPQGFKWGTATAAYQIEGAAREDGRGESIWDRFSHTPGRVRNGDTGDVACDHYHRYLEDIATMRDLRLQAYRFSIAWPRVFPTGAAPLNAKGLDFYSRLVDALLEAGIEPTPTLYHWDLPQALEDRGGWPNIETADRFAEYAEACFRALGDRVKTWITLNEPWCTAYLGYVSGDQAPGRKNEALGFQAAHTLLVAHGLAVQRFREVCPDGRIGITISVSPGYPLTDKPEDIEATRRAEAHGHHWFLDPVHFGDYPPELREAYGDLIPQFTPAQRAAVTAPLDFLGVNYYFRGMISDDPGGTGLRARWSQPTEGIETAMGWEVYPDGLYHVLREFDNRYGHPLLYITENGAAFDDVVGPDGSVDDENRRAFLESHFRSAARAIEDGVNLGGYYVWSLLDNFEWSYGYDKRFGIVHVDYPTQKRTLKTSARWYAGVIGRNAV